MSQESPQSDNNRLIPADDLAQVARGFLMGGADIIPGVSGGTVALILGIYERLVTAISHVDLTLLALLRKQKWSAAAAHLDLRFLLCLGCGIALGIAGLASLMHYLLEHQLQHTYAAFFGLILASSLLVGRMVARWGVVEGICALSGTLTAFWLVTLPFTDSPPDGNGYVFFCGTIAICAMILPGISGAFILLILGKYSDITKLLDDLLHGDFTLAALVTIGVFIAGCLVGLLSFSKVLRWLLARHEPQTMAVLCGFMVGSLWKIWPFKEDLNPQVTEFKFKQFRNIWPDSFGAPAWISIGVTIAAIVFVLALDYLTSGHEHIPPLEADEESPQNSQH